MLKSQSRDNTQMILHVVDAIALYSASPEERETIDCFLDFQDIKESLRNTHNPVVDLQLSTQPARSLSQKAFNRKSEAAG